MLTSSVANVYGTLDIHIIIAAQWTHIIPVDRSKINYYAHINELIKLVNIFHIEIPAYIQFVAQINVISIGKNICLIETSPKSRAQKSCSTYNCNFILIHNFIFTYLLTFIFHQYRILEFKKNCQTSDSLIQTRPSISLHYLNSLWPVKTRAKNYLVLPLEHLAY